MNIDNRDNFSKTVYAPWVGLVFALLFPGSSHFFAGKRFSGLLWCIAGLAIALLQVFVLSIPGIPIIGAMFFAVTVCLVFYAALFVSSWRPIRRIGYFGWILFIFFILLFNLINRHTVLLVFKQYAVETFVVNGMSMAPTLVSHSPASQTADIILVNKLIYRFSMPHRGDVVLYKTLDRKGISTVFTKRVVGLPGEKIDIESPYVIVDGKKLTDPPIFGKLSSKKDGYAGYVRMDDGIQLPIKLGPDDYFLLGDNSPTSLDSRFQGPVSRKNIIGRAIRIYYPLSRMQELE